MRQNLNMGVGVLADRIVYQAAAAGDLEAQRILTQAALDTRDEVARGGEAIDVVTLEAIFWARLAAAHGEAPDGMRLAEALAHGSNWLSGLGMVEAADCLSGEAVALLRLLSAGGHAKATADLAACIADVPPRVVSISSHLLEANNAPAQLHH